MGKTKIMMILFFVLTLVMGIMLISDKGLNLNKTRLDNWTWNDNWNGNGPKITEKDKEKKPDALDKKKSIKDQGGIVANNYEEALKKSNEINKNILLFFTADWCPYCTKMKTESLLNNKVKNSLESYIFLTVDADKDKDLIKKFEIKSLPSFVVIDKNEKKIKTKKGFIKSEEFVDWLK